MYRHHTMCIIDIKQYVDIKYIDIKQYTSMFRHLAMYSIYSKQNRDVKQ